MMNRLAVLVIIWLMATTAGVSAYDGPGSATYDRTVNSIRVVLNSQSPVIAGGWSKFRITAHVPIVVDTVGQLVLLQLRRVALPNDLVVGSCSYQVQSEDVGQTKVVACDLTGVAPNDGTTSVVLYPYVVRNSAGGSTLLVHNGQPNALTISIVTDDVFEENDDINLGPDLGSGVNLGGYPIIFESNLISNDKDYFRFTAPHDGTSEIAIDFWNDISDLDLFLYRADNVFLKASGGSGSREVVRIPTVAGATYKVYVKNFPGLAAFYNLTVTHLPPDVVTITAGPAGTPNPVSTGGSAALTVTATDSLGDPLGFYWQASCPLGSSGTFQPSAFVANPTWIAPANDTGTTASCTITVTVFDGFGNSVTNAYVQQVHPVDTVTITAGPTGSPNPVASAGQVSVAVTAIDSIGHSLTYAWLAACPTLGANGTFTGSGASRTWKAPPNATGIEHSCTIAVTASDGLGLRATASYTQRVQSVADAVTITSGPSGTPNPVPSGGVVTLALTAIDTIIGHALTYAWTATCSLASNGTFSPGPGAATPMWTAPVNKTGVEQSCALQVTVSDPLGTSATASFTQRVATVPDAITLSAGPSGSPEPVASGEVVTLTLVASDSLDHALAYAWTATCSLPSNGTFQPGPSAPAPSWAAPPNLTGAQHTCTISVTVTDGHGQSVTASHVQRVNSVPDAITVWSGPDGTPNPAESGGTATLEVVATDSLGHALSYAWTATCPLPTTGTFVPDAFAPATTWVAPVNATGLTQTCTLAVTINDGHGQVATFTHAQQVVSLPDIITVLSGPTGSADPVTPGTTVPLAVSATDSLGHPLTYSWAATCPLASNGTFSPSSAGPSPTWTAPPNATGASHTCSIAVTIRDGHVQTTATLPQVVTSSASCTYAVTPVETSLPSSGGASTIQVTTLSSCPWTATSDAPWIAVTGSEGRTGSGTITLTVAPASDPAPRSGTVQVAGRSVAVRQEGTSYTYFFAEGATLNGFFDTRLALLNPDATQSAQVAIDFLLKDTATVLTHRLVVGSHSRATIDVAALGGNNPSLRALASAEFSVTIRSDRPIVADRVMTWDNRGYGSHAETSIAAPASTWYLAEGATIGDFDLYYLIQNPNNVALDNEIEVTYLLPPPVAPVVRTYSVGPNTRRNIAVHMEPGLADVEVSAIIRTPADKPIIVERAMYLSSGGLFYGAGHESAGITSPGTQWFFAEGATGTFFDLFILVGNPNEESAQVSATFRFDDGTTCSKAVGNTWEAGNLVIAGRSRYNMWVDFETLPGCPRSLANASVSATIASDLPVIAERTMWWPGPTAANWAEAHNSPGAMETGTKWALAEGQQGGPRGAETYILVANTSNWAGVARVTLYFEDGTTAQKDFTLPPNSRINVAPGAAVASGGFGPVVQGKRFGAVIESLPAAGQPGPAELVVERSVYSNGPGAAVWAAGTSALATKLR